MDCDLSCSEEGTDVSHPLETAVLLSIFCDARAGISDDIHAGSDRRGWWAEAYFDAPDTWGSDLWQVVTRKATADTLVFAQRACERALEWLIDDGICRQVDVETWWLEGRQGYMGILVTLHKPDILAPQYVGPWEIHYAMD
jgi:phage gp46-like protein